MASRDGIEQGNRRLHPGCTLEQLFQRAGTARGAARRQVPGGEHLEQLVRIHAVGLAQAADLVGEAGFERVPRVVRLPEHFRGFEVGAHEPSGLAGVERRQHVAAGTIELADHRAVAQRVSLHAYAEVLARALARAFLQGGNQQLARGAGKNGAADGDDRRPFLASERATEALAGVHQRTGVHAHQHYVGIAQAAELAAVPKHAYFHSAQG
jgi:hypothetical protein